MMLSHPIARLHKWHAIFLRAAAPAFTLTEMLVTVAGLACLVVAMAHVVLGAKAAACQSACAQNLYRLGEALSMYAFDNDGLLPDSGAASTLGGPVPDDGIHFPSRFTSPGTCAWPHVRDVGNQANLWLLVRGGYAEPAQFICPATTDRPSLNPPNSPAVMGFLATDPSTGRAVPAEDGFLKRIAAGRCSYSYQVQLAHPNTRFEVPAPAPLPAPADDSSDEPAAPADAAPAVLLILIPPITTNRWLHPPDLAILADRNPYTRTDLVRQPVVPAEEQPEANSLNHGGGGQNVLYLGGEVLWQPTPLCGPRLPAGGHDNIYWPQAGRPDDAKSIPRSASDSFLAP